MLHDPYTKDIGEISNEIVRLKASKELLEALDKYDEFLTPSINGVTGNKAFTDKILRESREGFYKWQERFVERR